MVSGLDRCRALWGTCEIRDGLPALAEVADAVYLPCSDGPWGLYADGARLTADGGKPGEPMPAVATETAPPGRTLYLGPMVAHYGHVLVDVLPRAWPLADWQGERPRLLCHSPGPEAAWREAPFLAAILAALGLTSDDVVVFDRPTRLTSVTVPATALGSCAFAHPVYGRLGRRVGADFLEGTRTDRVARPVYLAKTRLGAGVARIVNEAEVADELDRLGVEIVYPETLGFADQVRLFAERRTILGSAGSALHTALFSAPGRRVLALNWTARLNADFALIDELAGTQARYYHPLGTVYEEAQGFQFGWRLADPRGVARALYERAETWEGRGLAALDARDAAEEAARRRPLARLRAYAGRLAEKIRS